jgi:hypothetical protein
MPEPDDLPPGSFTSHDPRIAAVDWLEVDERGHFTIEVGAAWGADPADAALFLTELAAEADASGPATPGVQGLSR